METLIGWGKGKSGRLSTHVHGSCATGILLMTNNSAPREFWPRPVSPFRSAFASVDGPRPTSATYLITPPMQSLTVCRGKSLGLHNNRTGKTRRSIPASRHPRSREGSNFHRHHGGLARPSLLRQTHGHCREKNSHAKPAHPAIRALSKQAQAQRPALVTILRQSGDLGNGFPILPVPTSMVGLFQSPLFQLLSDLIQGERSIHSSILEKINFSPGLSLAGLRKLFSCLIFRNQDF